MPVTPLRLTRHGRRIVTALLVATLFGVIVAAFEWADEHITMGFMVEEGK
jgi:hypothetical protein